jgi:SAM-dependent methyltransferase
MVVECATLAEEPARGSPRAAASRSLRQAMTPPDKPATEHWNSLYLEKPPDGVSWYRPHLDHSWQLLEPLHLPHTARLVDVGGGASTFVDDALDRGFENVTVIDLAEAALAVARRRLGDRSANVRWLSGDITQLQLEASSCDVWHDRAVFHFLTAPADQARYMNTLKLAVAAGGYVVIGMFGPNGPEKCSGLPTLRLSGDELFKLLPDGFEKLSTSTDVHVTPWGSAQDFSYLLARRR